MSATYYSQILNRWNWPMIEADSKKNAVHKDCSEGCDADGHMGMCFLGTVMNVFPSGKFYTLWTTNQTTRDVDRDERFSIALNKAAELHGGYIENGEGDPTDLFFTAYWTNEELAND